MEGYHQAMKIRVEKDNPGRGTVMSKNMGHESIGQIRDFRASSAAGLYTLGDVVQNPKPCWGQPDHKMLLKPF